MLKRGELERTISLNLVVFFPVLLASRLAFRFSLSLDCELKYLSSFMHTCIFRLVQLYPSPILSIFFQHELVGPESPHLLTRIARSLQVHSFRCMDLLRSTLVAVDHLRSIRSLPALRDTISSLALSSSTPSIVYLSIHGSSSLSSDPSCP